MIFTLDQQDVTLMKKLTSGCRVGLTSGCYDLFHYLHLVFLEKCKRQCDFLIVGVDTDSLVKHDKGDSRPIIPEAQRAVMLNAIKCVDAVFLMDSTGDFLKAAKELGVTTIFKNDRFKPEEVIGKEYANVVIVPDVRIPVSTSEIIQECSRRMKADANLQAAK